MNPSLYSTIFEIEERYWWSVGTRRIFREWIGDGLLGRAGPVSILDVGCGSGVFARELSDLGTVTGLDISRLAVGYTRERGIGRICVASAEAVPFADHCFDVACAVDVIEHADEARVLAEIARVLRPGGVALLHVPAFPILWGEHDEAAHHLRRYRRQEFVRAVTAAGFQIERLSYVNFIIFPPVAVFRIVKRLTRSLRPRTPEAEIYSLPPLVNQVLMSILGAEQRLLRRVNFPFGVSLLCRARRPA